jgi:hypothetical protein
MSVAKMFFVNFVSGFLGALLAGIVLWQVVRYTHPVFLIQKVELSKEVEHLELK